MAFLKKSFFKSQLFGDVMFDGKEIAVLVTVDRTYKQIGRRQKFIHSILIYMLLIKVYLNKHSKITPEPRSEKSKIPMWAYPQNDSTFLNTVSIFPYLQLHIIVVHTLGYT